MTADVAACGPSRRYMRKFTSAEWRQVWECTCMTTYADLAASTPTRELLRQSTTHKITCECDRCFAIYQELQARGAVRSLPLADHEGW